MRPQEAKPCPKSAHYGVGECACLALWEVIGEHAARVVPCAADPFRHLLDSFWAALRSSTSALGTPCASARPTVLVAAGNAERVNHAIDTPAAGGRGQPARSMLIDGTLRRSFPDGLTTTLVVAARAMGTFTTGTLLA
eukprot:CAMPEP_0181226748 /NCGR_PEP_ID=MMETSP1096-20121128/32420_1 /TAXON_ID=156174 ORGANISM="Chrysochromulina ericina, Strain CCMP281" /NCGR_SAMPLE_ID=MMETSP1096 /ASSEMBLY_ACC=CAM_ASM_000453 /LENGTH=137 /DNA_ID=CAMNT_0023320107 /DNA_START=1632 /DNA_END=2045 /DNA_ORIENTATION=-